MSIQIADSALIGGERSGTSLDSEWSRLAARARFGFATRILKGLSAHSSVRLADSAGRPTTRRTELRERVSVRRKSSKSSIVTGSCIVGLLFFWHSALGDASPSQNHADHSTNPEVIADSNLPMTVSLGNRQLFDVVTGIDSLTAAQRAKVIETKLLALANGPDTSQQSLRVVELHDISEIFAGDVLIRTLTEQDAVASGTSRQQLAAAQMEIIRLALAREFRDRDMAHILRAAGYSVMATLGLVVAIFVIRRCYRWTHVRLNRVAEGWSSRSPLERLKLLDSQALTKASPVNYQGSRMAYRFIRGLSLR